MSPQVFLALAGVLLLSAGYGERQGGLISDKYSLVPRGCFAGALGLVCLVLAGLASLVSGLVQ